MSIEIHDGLRELAPGYDAVLCDLWGAVHDGIEPYPGAIDCLHAIRAAGVKVMLLSNAPRPSSEVGQWLADNIGVPTDAYDGVLTSGDATIAALNQRDDAEHAAIGQRYFDLGPSRNKTLHEAITGAEPAPFEQAEFILCSGLYNDETDKPEDYRETLAQAVARGMALVCVNPDRVVNRGERLVPCAGAIAEYYENLGGKTLYHGKPWPSVYDRALRAMGVEKPRALMVGDGLQTDIEGARRYGIDSVWIAGGIHAADVGFKAGDAHLDGAKVAAFCAEKNQAPTYAVPALVW
ncbi:MAG: TIGR01459 family HAD-type hydrolase [Alphaproteobacteria bacterium]